ncbi:MAG: hypothetical protein IKG91_02415, partial [Firmicutes bacterium]|nr:hypothetical protein [Bacillota bacterium]
MSSTKKAAPKTKEARVTVFERIGKKLSDFGKRFVDGSPGTKLSHFVFGAGNFYHKQYIKGALFLLLQLGILAVMIFCPSINGTPYGWKALKNLSLKNVTEGGDFDPMTGHLTVGSDCKLMILFGFVTIAMILIYFLIWNMNIKSSVKADNDKRVGKKPTTFKEDLAELLDGKFHVLM